MMTKAEVNEQLKELLNEEMSNPVLKKARDLRDEYQAASASERKKQLDAFLEKGGEQQDFAFKRDEHDELFDQLWAKLSKTEKEWRDKEAADQKVNYKKKSAVLDQIKEITENEENIKAAFSRVKELEEEWKSIGSVPAEKFNELQAEFSKVRDEFYYNMRIYKELFEHDLKRNLQFKEELAEKMEKLLEQKSIKEVETLVKTYLKEWDETGPTFREEWEKVRDRFRGAQRRVFDRIKDHYKQVREQHAENLKKKEELCEKAEEIIKEDIKSKKRWNKLTDEFKALQKEWKSVGFAPRDQNEEVWQRFKTAGDEFFERKSNYFKQIRERENKVRDIKEALIKEAESLKDSEEWKDAADQLKALQRKWKNAGAASQRDEQRLWKQFRAACDHFFERKKEFMAGREDREAENLKKKNELIDQIESLEPSENEEEALKELEKITSEFNSIGFVPIKEKGNVMNRFNKATQKAYVKLGLKEEEIKKRLFKNKLEDIVETGNERALDREKQNLRDKINELQSTVTQYENNMQFFNTSKGDNPLVKEVEQKIDRAKKDLEIQKEKLNMLRKAER